MDNRKAYLTKVIQEGMNVQVKQEDLRAVHVPHDKKVTHLSAERDVMTGNYVLTVNGQQTVVTKDELFHYVEHMIQTYDCLIVEDYQQFPVHVVALFIRHLGEPLDKQFIFVVTERNDVYSDNTALIRRLGVVLS